MISSVVRHVTSLPILQETLFRLQELLTAPEGDLHYIAELIENDHAIAAMILRLGNSSAYNFSNRRVTNLRDIIARVGIEGLKRFLQTFSSEQDKAAHDDSHEFYHLWQRAFVNRALVNYLERVSSLSFLNGEILTLAGHLMEIGLVARAHYSPALSNDLIHQSRVHHNDLFEVERIGLHETHGELGARILEQWKVCSDITIPVRYHENPDQAPKSYRTSAHLLHCASAVHSYVSPSPYGKTHTSEQIETILQMSGIDPRFLPDITSFIHEQSDRSRTMLSLWGMGKNFSKLRTTGSTSLLRPV